ncbi:hypothetical protein BOSEA31B_20321 [Hyphomicrobiales bacterium]|nr:hypothetical protein BOSEA31B_20321 [Hyphomicrobiales bacterium]CAH1702304.1 hypothetical protein BOSEA1005_30177 [Hyphomicrobiales bacterium]
MRGLPRLPGSPENGRLSGRNKLSSGSGRLAFSPLWVFSNSRIADVSRWNSRPIVLRAFRGGLVETTPRLAYGCKSSLSYRHLASGHCVGLRDLAKSRDRQARLACSRLLPGIGAYREGALGGRTLQ